MRPILAFAAAALVLTPAIATAQDPAPAPSAPAPEVGLVRPGMTENEVRATWGDPSSVKKNGDWTFLFYRNYDERRVGWLDVVFLQNGQVVDCIARGSGHAYAGQSSSPGDRQPGPTRTTPTDPTAGAVTGVRINP